MDTAVINPPHRERGTAEGGGPTPPGWRVPRSLVAPTAGDAARQALRSRSYRIFMAGSLISWIGDWMDLTALNWAVLTLTDSPIDLALINACRLVPVFALSLPAGVLADRHDRRRLLIGLQAALMV